jgi:hypothetical protein
LLSSPFVLLSLITHVYSSLVVMHSTFRTACQVHVDSSGLVFIVRCRHSRCVEPCGVRSILRF